MRTNKTAVTSSLMRCTESAPVLAADLVRLEKLHDDEADGLVIRIGHGAYVARHDQTPVVGLAGAKAARLDGRASLAAAVNGSWTRTGAAGPRPTIWFTCVAGMVQSTRQQGQKEEDSVQAYSGWRRAGESSCNPLQKGKSHQNACDRNRVYKTAYSPSPRWPFICMKCSAAHGSKALAPDSFIN